MTRWPLPHWTRSSAPRALLFAAGMLLLWHLLAEWKFISPVFFPSPARTLGELWRQASQGDLWRPLADTGLRMLYGWALACLAGLALGAAIGSSRRAREYLEPSLEFMRPLPASAIIPPAILILGLNNEMAVAVIAFGAIWPVLLASVHGFASVAPELEALSATLVLSRRAFLAKIAFPAAMPEVLAGARVSLAIALILAVVTEIQASLPGLGQNILLAQRSYRSPELYAGVVTLGLMGYALNYALTRMERRLLRWRTPFG